MFQKSLIKILEATKGKSIIIVSAGLHGKELAGALIDRDREVRWFFDNKEELWGLDIFGIPIKKPFNANSDDVCYVISVFDEVLRYVLKRQLAGLGIPEESVLCYFPARCLDFHATLLPEEYRGEIDEMFREKFGRSMDWENPKTYSEKINWEKLNVYDDRFKILTDKSQARNWVGERIGTEHLTKHYGVWNNLDEIDFSKLPKSFVLKANNASGRNILVRDKEKLNISEIKDKVDYWMSTNYMFHKFENVYDGIEPKMIAEEYLEGMAETLYDYNIYCFHGEPKYIWCIKGSHKPECTAAFYDTDWNRQPFSYGYPLDIYPAPKPEKLEEMLELTKILCRDFRHVRVDWYIMPDGRILFGEMTFQTWSGLDTFIPEKYDEYFGSLI